jgi:hypothetical protein
VLKPFKGEVETLNSVRAGWTFDNVRRCRTDGSWRKTYIRLPRYRYNMFPDPIEHILKDGVPQCRTQSSSIDTPDQNNITRQF